jgi:hypothetical protein
VAIQMAAQKTPSQKAAAMRAAKLQLEDSANAEVNDTSEPFLMMFQIALVFTRYLP